MSLFPRNLNEYVASLGIPRGPKSKAYLVDTVNGSDSNPGTSWQQPLKSVTLAEDMCVADRHDTVLFLSGDTADNPTAAIVWDKDYTHLIGLSSDVYGLGQRCRIVAQAAADLTVPVTFSGNGCIVKNLQIYNEHATGDATGTAIVTGSRNYFENVFFMVPVSATAASYSLKMSGNENTFYRCTIGQFTNARSAASYGLWLHGATAVSRNRFVDCEFLSWAASADHVHVLVDADIVTEPWITWFENCMFDNIGTALTEAINDNSTAAGHQIVLRGRDNAVLNATAVGGTLTYIFAPDVAANVSGLLMIAVAES
jgi:hypothetical protein